MAAAFLQPLHSWLSVITWQTRIILCYGFRICTSWSRKFIKEKNPMEKVPKKNPDIIWKNVRGETVLLNSVSGRYYGLNKVGCAFWEKIDSKRSLSEIVSLLLEDFNVERERLTQDIDDLMKSLTENKLITLD
jgi:hypothetical protein